MGVWVAAAGAVVSGLFQSRAANKQSKDQKAQSELAVRGQMWQDQYARRNQIEDRAYKEKAIGGYRDFYRGPKPLMSPEYSDPSAVEVTDPFAKKPKKK